VNVLAKSEAGRSVRPVTPPGDDAVSGAVSDALCGILADGVDVHRCLAAKALGRIGGASARQSLIGALLDEDTDVRTDAAEALLALADPGAGKQLFENLLGDPCAEVKLAAIRTLAALQEREVIPWLRRMVAGRDEEIAWDEDEFYESGWDDHVEIQTASIAALGELKAAEAVPDIIEALRDENAQDMTEIAFKALTRMSNAGIDAIAAFLDESEPVRFRRRAAAVLAAVTDEDVSAPLARAFADPSADVRAAAMRARAGVAPDETGLELFLEDPDAGVRAEAVGLFGHRQPERLVAMLDDPSGAVRIAALAALTEIADEIGDEPPVEKLRALAASRNAGVAAAAAAAFAALTPGEALPDLVELLGDKKQPAEIRVGALRGLALIGDAETVAALVRVIDDDVRAVRLEVMSILARLARQEEHWPNAAGDALLEALRGRYSPEPDEETPAESEAAAEEEPEEPQIDRPSADPDKFPTSTLESILEDEPGLRKTAGLPDQGLELGLDDMERLALARQIVGKKRISLEPTVVVHEDIRRFAARVLGDLGHAVVMEELANVLLDPDADLRLAAADSLARIAALPEPLSASVDEQILAALPEADRDLKVLLIRALATSENEQAADALKTRLADQDGFVRTEAVRALSCLDQTGPEVEAMLEDPDSSTRLAAAKAVASGSGAVARLVDYAFSHEGLHRREVACMLRDVAPEAASSAFMEVLRDPERKRFWPVAIEALEELNRRQ